MQKFKSLFILGYSGHAYVVLDIALSNGFVPKGYFDFQKAQSNPYQISYLGNENTIDLSSIVGSNFVFPAIGSNQIRKKVYHLLKEQAIEQTVLVDKSASVSTMASIGNSSLVAPKAVINSRAIIGEACVINTGAIIEHECKIDDFSHIAPGSVLTGNVSIGKNVLVGAGSVVRPGITICDDVIIGVGSVVVRDILEKGTYAGNPAKRLR
ncbi:acetyltransferase [uncultured Zobellia sp.]|uniref:acetyltransferase n=1 Tax=uncultured Zobellia sp. TaxID=255433 RepID=UPI00259A8DB5|nr:acetyltransferase [uncultured Zobellia sp.]